MAAANPALSPATQEQLKWKHAAKWVRGRKRETPTRASYNTVDWAELRLVFLPDELFFFLFLGCVKLSDYRYKMVDKAGIP